MSDDNLSSVTSLLRSVGGWTVPSGRGLFMLNMITTNIAVAALGGVTGAYLTAWFVGPVAALGFAGGSCIGYVTSTVFFWRSVESQAIKAYDDYPQLMMLHLFRNYRTMGFDKVPIATAEERSEFRGRIMGSVALRCLLMAAWHTAGASIEEITSRREAQLVDVYSEQRILDKEE